MQFQIDQIQNMIYEIRGQRVMLDSDLAKLYGVEVRVLNQSVRRNLKRFPDDFMFKLIKEEYDFLKSQIVTSKLGRGGKQKQPLVFTENGVAMLSGVLNSPRAIEVFLPWRIPSVAKSTSSNKKRTNCSKSFLKD